MGIYVKFMICGNSDFYAIYYKLISAFNDLYKELIQS